MELSGSSKNIEHGTRNTELMKVYILHNSKFLVPCSIFLRAYVVQN